MFSYSKIDLNRIHEGATHKDLFKAFVVEGKCFYKDIGCSWTFKYDGKSYSSVTRHIIAKHMDKALGDYDINHTRHRSEIALSISKQVRLMASCFNNKKQPPKLKIRDSKQLHFKNFVVQALVHTPFPLSITSSIFLNIVVKEVAAIVRGVGSP